MRHCLYNLCQDDEKLTRLNSCEKVIKLKSIMIPSSNLMMRWSIFAMHSRMVSNLRAFPFDGGKMTSQQVLMNPG